jgi:hypothetical protein
MAGEAGRCGPPGPGADTLVIACGVVAALHVGKLPPALPALCCVVLFYLGGSPFYTPRTLLRRGAAHQHGPVISDGRHVPLARLLHSPRHGQQRLPAHGSDRHGLPIGRRHGLIGGLAAQHMAQLQPGAEVARLALNHRLEMAPGEIEML